MLGIRPTSKTYSIPAPFGILGVYSSYTRCTSRAYIELAEIGLIFIVYMPPVIEPISAVYMQHLGIGFTMRIYT